MAPEQAAGAAGRRARRPLRARPRALRGAGGRQPGPRRLALGHRAADRHRAAAARRATAPTCPAALCAALDRTVRPDPEARGELDDLFDALADALPEVSDDGGADRPAPARARDPRRCRRRSGGSSRPRRRARSRGRRWPGSRRSRRCRPPLAAAATAALVAVLPRAGWLLAAVARGAPARARARAAARRGAAGAGARRCSAAAAAGRRALPGRCPPLAPALGLLGLAGAYPALAGRAPRWSARARARRARAPGGSSWPSRCSARALVFGAGAGHAGPRRASTARAGIAAGDVIAPACGSGALLLAPSGAPAALVLPWLVRGRSLAADAVGADGVGGRHRRRDRGARRRGSGERVGAGRAARARRPARSPAAAARAGPRARPPAAAAAPPETTRPWHEPPYWSRTAIGSVAR